MRQFSIPLALVLFGCQSPATVVLVAMDTNVPVERAMRVNLVATKPGSSALPESRVLERGQNGLRFPLSFGVTPASADRSGQAELRFDVELPGRSATDPTIRWTRRVRFAFVPRTRGIVRVFLPLRCGEPAVGCPPEERDRCTVARLCELSNLTCGNNGECTSIDVQPDPFDGDASFAEPDAASAMDVVNRDTASSDIVVESAVDSSLTDASSDAEAGAPDATCTPNCAGRECGSDGCGGACGPGCPPLAGTVPATCTLAGRCNYLCAPGFANCGGPADCETPLGTATNCQRCGDACTGATPICNSSMGRCVASASCVAPNTLCGGACVDTRTDTRHCGACGRACAYPNATATCTTGTCSLMACMGTFASCDGNDANGCEIDTNRDDLNCGSCGNVCSGGQTCVSGRCTTSCPPGFADCNGLPADGCETNITNDREHCGGCGRDCAAAANCVASTCSSCPAGQIACGGTCQPSMSCGSMCPNATGSDSACIAVPRTCSSRCVSGIVQCVAAPTLNAACAGGLGRCNELGQCRCTSAPSLCRVCGMCGACGSACS